MQIYKFKPCLNYESVIPFMKVRACLQVLPWILDVGYTILAVALLVAFMGHILFGDFEATMTSLPSSIAGMCFASALPSDQCYGHT